MSSNPKMRVLIVDSDVNMGRFLSSHLIRRGFDVSNAHNGDEALRVFRIYDPTLVLLDLALPGTSALDALDRIKQIKRETAVITLLGKNDPEQIFRASKLGADDYLSKPFEPVDLDVRINRLLDKQRVLSESPSPRVRHEVRRASDFSMLFGTSPKMEEIKNTIEQVADTNATVLIRGESGTGKEVVARMVYAGSGRRDKSFVKVNCAAIPYELLESELFGYEPGAFTGASRQKLGKFDLANAGTLFLDEVSEMHPALQAKLLHVLQDGEFSRLGGKRDISVDVRVLAATNKLLERAVEEGLFREDLFYRLNVITIHIPPLRERREEIPVFLDFFLTKYSEVYGKTPPAFGDDAVSRMMEYHWPGNIRELENLVKRYVIVGNEAQIVRELSARKPDGSGQSPYAAKPEDASGAARSTGAHGGHGAIPIDTGKSSSSATDSLSLLEIGRRAAMAAEREAIERVLTQTRWNRRQAARILKISYKALLNKLKLIEEQNPSQNKNLSA